MIHDADPAADGPELDAVIGFQLARERGDFFDGFDERLDGSELRADVHLQPAKFHVRQFLGGARVEVGDGIEVDAELVLRLARGNVFVGLGVDVRVHPHGSWSDQAKFAGDLVEVSKFFLALDVEGVDALLECVFDFRPCFANAGEGAFCRIATGLNDSEQFAARDDIESCVLGRKEPQHREVGICLHCIGDFVVDGAQSLVQATVVVADRIGGINVERGAVFVGNVLKVDVLAMKRAVAVGKSVHGEACKRWSRAGQGRAAFEMGCEIPPGRSSFRWFGGLGQSARRIGERPAGRLT